METETKKSKILGISPELFWAIFSAIVIGAFFLGSYIGQAKFDKEKSDYYEQTKTLKLQNSDLYRKLDSIINPDSNALVTTYDIFLNGTFGKGLYMGENTKGSKTNWAKIVDNDLFMDYPKGEEFGSVFISVGMPSKEPPPPRLAKDFSQYRTLALELKGDPGSTIFVGLKDNLDPDDGHESKKLITLKNSWDTYYINLRENFESADLRQLYLVTEFVFGSKAQKLSVRRIQFVK